MRATALRERVAGLPPDQQATLLGPLADLSAALEELAAVQGELREQANALAAADQALVVDRQHYRDLFEVAPDAYVVTDPWGTIREANPAACTLLNYAQSFLVGRPLALFVTKNEGAAFRRWFRGLQPGPEPAEWSGRLQPRRGGARDVVISVRTSRKGNGQPSELLWVLRDVTERKRLQAVLSSMVHDFSTPLTVIMTAVDVLFAEPLGEKDADWRELLQMVDAATGQLKHLVSQLHAASHLEARVWQAQPDWHDPAELLGRVTQRLDPARTRVHLQLSDDVQPGYLDYMVVELIVTNLLEHVLKDSPAESRVDVTAHRCGEVLVIEVADRGPGGARTDTERSFQKLCRGADRPAGVSGSGPDLLIARELAQVHGGDVRYTARPGGGSVYTVTLPIAGPTDEAAHE
jgi:PAS domain S-box-containing protein